MELLGLDEAERDEWTRKFNAGSLHYDHPPLFLYNRPAGVVGEREVMQAIAQERGVGFIDLQRVQPDPKAIRSVKRNLVTETKMVPVKRDGSTLWIAMSNPRDTASLDRFRLETGCRLVPVMAMSNAIQEWIERHYPEGG